MTDVNDGDDCYYRGDINYYMLGSLFILTVRCGSLEIVPKMKGENLNKAEKLKENSGHLMVDLFFTIVLSHDNIHIINFGFKKLHFRH